MMKENIYTLFVGFRKLGEFKSILEAKEFAKSSNLAGAFNLIGKNYSDSWYVFKSEVKNNEN
ncbi:hypothetical protein [uncultured Dysgonomonas sp.]|uniref:SPOR domain-containing protein n=1 Tax=uncultured Dysgonomonas sp. TaxID=206096 RepID=A0A212JMQ8_9BACT|nr:hypothetical protein [uncultured Dysgonomonas sp.]SBW00700.1 conserved hypothetical protein [uncultured Dysgonomonas sp.]